MQTTAAITIAYGFLVLTGGLLGYWKARSAPSLIAGLAFGLGLLVSGYYQAHGERMGLLVGLGLAAALLVIMGMRFAKGRKFMPAGFIAVLSVIVTVWLALVAWK
jgi:uncharacterized membrane protein (UPF0136 family)